MRLQFDQFAMTDHAAREQRPEVDQQLPDERAARRRHRQKTGQSQQDHGQRPEHSAVIPAFPIEAQDECQQVQSERHDPQERHHRDIETDLVCGGQQQHGRGRCQTKPKADLVGARLGSRHFIERVGSIRRRLGRGAPGKNGATTANNGEQRETDRPDIGLRRLGEHPLKGQWIGQQCQQ